MAPAMATAMVATTMDGTRNRPASALQMAFKSFYEELTLTNAKIRSTLILVPDQRQFPFELTTLMLFKTTKTIVLVAILKTEEIRESS